MVQQKKRAMLTTSLSRQTPYAALMSLLSVALSSDMAKSKFMMKAHTEEKKDHVYRNHTVSLDGFEEFAGFAPDTNTYCEQDEADQLMMAQIELQVLQIRATLSEKQFRRVWMYFVDEMTMDEIGEKEEISHQNVSKSIDAAMKKIQKFFPQAQK